ncbi:MAG: prephenate dehydrogenase/arogenate dehydrogenase family protein [Burkholderiaceae bacterium]|nr:prephenate dehydrogenase/arogenate dehydrogenase family protein [Burkholderiaceae bacterium]
MHLNKIVIFGVGLIGGSVALALKKTGVAPKIVGVGRNIENLQTAINLGVIDEAEADIAKAVGDANLVLIATPVAQTQKILEAIIPHLSQSTVVTDAGSTKSDIAQYVMNASKRAKNPEHFLSQFVGGHPIAGAEKSGVTAAKEDLFIGKNVVLTPNEKTSLGAIKLVRELWQTTGANVSEMTAQTHDQIFAAVSHLPHLLAFALVNNLANRPNAKQLFNFAASGFRDFTRIAGSSPEMWRDISLANKTALLNELEAYQAEISALHNLLKNEDSQGLQAMFEQASQARQAWQKEQEK